MDMATTFAAPTLDTYADVVADNIRVQCARRGVSRSMLARAIDMDRASCGYRWRGQREWRLSELDRVADALGLSVVDLLTPPGGSEWRPRQDSNLQPSD